MSQRLLGRREILRGALWTSLLGLSGCAFGSEKYILKTFKESIPKELLWELPLNWKFNYFENEFELVNQFDVEMSQRADLLALGDGWISSFDPEDFVPIESDDLLLRLNKEARSFLLGCGEDWDGKVFPLLVSPWIMIFRNGNPWLDRAKKSWDVLLDPALKGEIILPNSPRLLMSIADTINEQSILKRLRIQSRTFDDRHGLNWILAGKAKVAVLPLSRCIRSLMRDPRLDIALPSVGAPLNWSVLLRPKSSVKAFPKNWAKASWDLPRISKLLSKGFIPPLPYADLSKGLAMASRQYQSMLLPSKEVWERCWSLPPLNDAGKRQLNSRWLNSAP